MDKNIQNAKKIVLNSARGPNTGAISERDPSNDPLKGNQMGY
jgi:hypothetical protein